MQDNGEIQEDRVARAAPGGGWLDDELRDTFPASDPLPHWVGPPRDLDAADRSQRGQGRGEPTHDVPLSQAPGSQP